LKVLDAPLSVTKNFISPEPREQSFRIAVTSKAFQILSSGVYTDKIAAVIRELGTNAADSHVAAGKPDVPFRVHVPTALEPWFAVHDEGIGMDEDDIYSTYTEYFNSDKTHTNALTGCLGIGSKSPFAYTDQFTVAATKDGVKRTFTAYLSEKKIPTLTKVDERKTRASNGVIITVPVKACDIEEFEAKCTEIYFWFGQSIHRINASLCC
jgi:HSP90 family molecular chaperone